MSEHPASPTDGLIRRLVIGMPVLPAAAGVLRVWNSYGLKERLDTTRRESSTVVLPAEESYSCP